MEQNTLNTQLLLEIALSQNIEGDAETILRNAIPVYLKKLGCFAAAVIHEDQIAFVQPNAIKNVDGWKDVCSRLVEQSKHNATEITETQLGSDHYYFYPLAGYGHMILGKKLPFAKDLKLELKKIVAQLGKNLQHAAQEVEVRETRQMLQSIFNEMADVVWSMRLPEYKVIFVSPSVEDLYGIPVGKWIEDNKLWERAIYHEDVGVVERIQQQMETKGYFNEKFRIVTASGEVKWVRNRAKTIYNEDRIPVRLDGIIMDRTSQYGALDQLEQEHRLQEVLIDIASTYINLDLNDVEMTINKSLEKMGQFVHADRSYIFDYNFDKETTSNTYEWCNTGINPEIENLQDVPMEYFPQWVESHQKGETFYIPDISALDETFDGLRSVLEPQGIKSLIAIPMIDQGELMGFVGFDSVATHHVYTEKEQRLLQLFGQMLINIRNRQKWEKQLRLQEEKYRNIIANMNLGLIELDDNNTILFANQSFCDMSGYSLTELIGQKAGYLIVPEDKRVLTGDLINGKPNGMTDSYEISVEDKNGNKRWWLVSGALNFSNRGQQTGSIGIYLDITEQKTLGLELEMAKSTALDAAKSKELFLANMSHEIRTPLNVIIGMIRELSKQNLGDDQRFYVAQSDSAAKHLLTILNHILDMAKIDSGQLTLEKADFSISAVSTNAFSILHSQAKEKNLGFNLSIDKRLHQAHIGDEGRLRQILFNILGNAIKFTERGKIDFAVELIEDYSNAQLIQFSVADTGIGMSEEFLDNLFVKFAQEQSDANRRYEGTGLGMTIARELIKLMGGDISIESKKLKGTKVTIKLRLPKGEISKLRYAAGNVEKDAYSGKHVLIVEDNDMNRFIAIQSLHFFGCVVDEAINGQEAIEKAQKYTYDMILMDIQMPVMDGVEATQFIRDNLKLNTPIIALTANAFRHDIERYLEAGMDNYVTKPFSEQELFAKLRPFLAQKYNDISPVESKAPLYNLSKLEKLSHGDVHFIEKMTTMFIELSEKAIIELLDAHGRKDYQQVSKIAHRMRPSIDNMGIDVLKSKIRELENFPLVGNDEERTVILRNIAKILTEVCEQIKATRLS
jgi:PAS domain S-box-containing protein